MQILLIALSVCAILFGFGLMSVNRRPGFLYALTSLTFACGGWFFLVVALTGGLHKLF